jgi:pimeloyl-ACP methyl ester carboxylesterase
MKIRSDDADLDVIDEGSGTAVVLLHAFPLNKETWDAQASVLARRARVVRFDIRGLGRSSVPDGPYLMATLGSDVAAVLDALGIGSAVVVGHSIGSYIAFAFYRMFAERVLGLGIVCGNAWADDGEMKLRRYALADQVEREGTRALVESYVPRYFAPPFYRERPELVTRATEIVEAASPAGAAGLLRGMAERDASDDLFEDIRVPVAILAGTMDAFGPVDRNERLASQIEGARLTLLECGHLPQWEASDATTSALSGLLDRVS